MKKLSIILSAFVCLMLGSICCVAQPEWSASLRFGDTFTPMRLEDESGMVSKTKNSYSLYAYGSGGFDFPYMPFEVYVDLKACANWFKTRFPGTEDYKKNTLLELKPGFGIRFYLKDLDVSPVLQAGINYNLYYYNGFYGKAKDQLNKGTNNTFGAGILIDEEDGFIIEVELPNQTLFNENFSSDGGYYYPYANLKQKKGYTISISYFYKF